MNGYDLAYALGAVALSPWWARKARGGWSQRFGHAEPMPPPAPGRPRLLLHAVSVGEVNALRELVPMLRQRVEVVVSASTDTGLRRALELYGPGPSEPGGVVRYPLDFSRSVARFLDAVQPDAVALVELELWPNFVAACDRRGIPVGIINGRLSARSFKGYRRVRGVLGRSFGRLAFAAVQDDAYAGRFVEMGVPADRVTVTGSMKWDTAAAVRLEAVLPQARELARAMGIDPARPLVVAGSTSDGEERLLHEACAACPSGAGPVQLLCAPRKPERFARAAADLPGCVRRSATTAAGWPAPLPGAGAGRFLLDTIGELRAAYALATVAVVGRTFGLHRSGRGGSDPIEPVALGRPTLMGEHFVNFESIGAALARSGAVRVVPADGLAGALAGLLGPGGASDLGLMARAGGAVIEAHRGATQRHAEMLAGLATLGAARRTRAGEAL